MGPAKTTGVLCGGRPFCFRPRTWWPMQARSWLAWVRQTAGSLKKNPFCFGFQIVAAREGALRHVPSRSCGARPSPEPWLVRAKEHGPPPQRTVQPSPAAATAAGTACIRLRVWRIAPSAQKQTGCPIQAAVAWVGPAKQRASRKGSPFCLPEINFFLADGSGEPSANAFLYGP